MKLEIIHTKSKKVPATAAFLIHDKEQLNGILPEAYTASVESDKKSGELQHLCCLDKNYFVILIDKKTPIDSELCETLRASGSSVTEKINRIKEKTLTVFDFTEQKKYAFCFTEGAALSNYQFLKYVSDKANKKNTLEKIKISSDILKKEDVKEISTLVESVFICRDLVNEPQSYLNAVQFSKEIEKLGKKAGFKVDVFGKKKIETLKMGGLLAVNKGSETPPTFNILTYQPKNAKNKKPIILVGKGVVYDTGGLSLKPTPNSMDLMKTDMAGAAAVVAAIHAIAKNKFPVYVIGLIPATDNRPGKNAYAPGDIITMYNGTTVEVLNTDAEGRMILADALAYAQKYKPELTVDIATLTGAAKVAIGDYGIVGMGTAQEPFDILQQAGEEVYERVVRFPFWKEYEDDIKSPIADIKNIGSGRMAGSITAGKFLEVFTKDKKGNHAYPWIHLDIAGPARLAAKRKYMTQGGSGVGVRLLYQFIKQIIK
ncbi:MAG: leucyl aminopeptidase [Bacteroidetes bacterium]|nr:MAG: leucyl aminopeptidase [Bacteroidota bacterium]